MTAKPKPTPPPDFAQRPADHRRAATWAKHCEELARESDREAANRAKVIGWVLAALLCVAIVGAVISIGWERA